MVDFPLCNVCNTGYTSPLDRRYHAQTTACDSCGPRYQLYDADGKLLKGINCINQAARLLESDSVLALHGIGGTHLVTKTSNYKPIRVLRERKNRFQRPFAIMEIPLLIVLSQMVSPSTSTSEYAAGDKPYSSLTSLMDLLSK